MNTLMKGMIAAGSPIFTSSKLLNPVENPDWFMSQLLLPEEWSSPL